MSNITREILLKYWGYTSFRPLQEDIVDSVINGNDTLALLPTGGGKSICFQVPAMTMDGTCIVITPLISLMKDQVLHLRDRGINAGAVFSGMHNREIAAVYNQAVFGNMKLLYVSPERLITDGFIDAIMKMKVNLLAIDESHCISQWGYDFRPPYLKIADIREYIPNAPVLALTATATPVVVKDIQQRLKFKRDNVFQTSYERKNVTYNVIKDADKYGLMFRLLNKTDSGSGIVYVRSRNKTKAIAEWLQNNGISATYYHAGLDAKTRDSRQQQWMDGKIKVIVATNAFGMGIDKPDVRIVVHIDLPDSLEAYFQEAGRAGRDLKASETYLIVSPQDITTLKNNIINSYPDLERIKNIYDSLCNYLMISIGDGQDQSYDFDINSFAASYNYSLSETFNSLKLMEREGYIALSDALDNPSMLWISAQREDLYRFQIEYKKFDILIQYLLRSLPGVLSNFVKIKEEAIANKLNISTKIVTEMLQQLDKLDFLVYIPRNEKPQIRFISERIDSKNFYLSDEVYKNRKNDAINRMNAVIEFVNNDKTCRSIQLLRYFGERTNKRCGRCDVCHSNNKMQITGSEYNNLEKIIENMTKDRLVCIEELLRSIKDYHEEKILETLRWMEDSGKIRINGDMVSLK